MGLTLRPTPLKPALSTLYSTCAMGNSTPDSLVSLARVTINAPADKVLAAAPYHLNNYMHTSNTSILSLHRQGVDRREGYTVDLCC